MAKVRFYVDVPEHQMSGFHLFATTAPCGSVCTGYKRVSFDVDMPPEVWKSHDVDAPEALVVGVEEPKAK